MSVPRFPRSSRPARRALAALAVCAALGAGSAGSPAAARTASGDVTRTVAYRGHTFTVPADWQVVDLGKDPTACVRFDRHAVYLGDPGERQDCPARATGRTEALWVQPAAATRASVTEDRTSRVFRATATSEGIAVTAPYGEDRATIQRVLDSAGLPVAAARAGQPGEAPSALTVPAGATAYRGRGFDTCTAPSRTAMNAWKSGSPYRAVGIYIGGVNRACAQAGLTSEWVRTQYANGWRFFPLYVGPQPTSGAGSCRNRCVSITDPVPQGRAAAEDAVAQAAALGLDRGSVLYNDLEQYTRGGALTPRVLGYLGAWTERLHELGYRSGAYGGVSSLVPDLVDNAGKATLPDVIHFAHWNGEAATDHPSLPATMWADQQRIHQYAGDRTETYGGVTINIDRDQLDVGTGT
ncbi:glycoside hydrolase domain-containing protein [Streptomyces kebangsaanensis]|uniref:glycoside hydrolase domain-containing protein n=1 Tax=Streptomyces kebangsaanensis TaxID=864058 RepID=UPI0009399D0D|nr:glycoside hydrolase domain-containing protein [Streptomyces kebangsaanensis]